MIHAFLLLVYVGADRQLVSDDMYFRSITDCNWYASRVSKRYGNHAIMPEDRVTAYCVPKLIDPDNVRLY